MEAFEENLLGSAVNGDRDAIAALLKRHGPAARQCLTGRIPQRWQSVLSEDDVMQQTYADAAASISQFDSKHESSFGKWLATIALRNLQDALKMLEAEKRGGNRRRVEPGTGDDSFVALYELLGSPGSTPSGHVARKEAIAALQCAIQRLPEAHVRVLRMYDFEGQPVRAVAEALRRTPGAVLMLRARALHRLHEIMGSTSEYFGDSS